MQSENRPRILIRCTAFTLHVTMCQKVPESNPRLTVSEGTCPPLCLRGGLGRTRVTWWRGRPCVGSSDRPSQDAERDSGEEYDGTEGGGEELESSQRPGSSEEPRKDYRGWEKKKWEGEDTVKVSRRGKSKGDIISVNYKTISDRSDIQWLIYTINLSDRETGKQSRQKTH